jgi:hypothetical protein
VQTSLTTAAASNVKYAAIAVAAIELTSFTFVGYKAYSFVTSTTQSTDLVQIGTLIHLICSALKALVALQIHSHASCQTERTPANSHQLSKSLHIVAGISMIAATVFCSFLYFHNGTVAVPAIVQFLCFTLMHWLFNKL